MKPLIPLAARLFLAGMLLALPSAQALAAEGEPRPSSGRAESVDAFEFFQEEAKVVTASRREQPVSEAPVAVDVITAEDIKASGATHLWDLLRFRVGMDVLDGRSVDGSRAVVAIRGFPQEHVRNLQVLLDGRSVYSALTGGAYWDQLPVLMEDIERIEIIRGPNAALYGSGAGLGVINIITRKPGPAALSLQASQGTQGATQSAVSLEGAAFSGAYRASYGFQHEAGFPLVAGGEGNDFVHSHKADLRTDWKLPGGSALELFAGGARYESGVVSRADSQSDFDQNFQMLKWAVPLGPHSSVEVLSSRSDYINGIAPSVSADGGTAQSRAIQFDEEVSHRLNWWDARMNTVYGLTYRGVTFNDPASLGAASQQTEELWSGYINQTARVSNSLQFSAAGSWEHSDIGGGGTEPNYQLASVWTPQEHHACRISYSVAHTVPTMYAAAADSGTPGLRILGNPNLRPQKLTSYETGYRLDAMHQRLLVESNLFYTKIEDIDMPAIQSITSGPDPSTTFGFENADQAIARGAEAQFKYRFNSRQTVYVNYTYEHVTDRQGNAGDVTENTPAHKVNAGGVRALGRGISAGVNVGYKDKYLIASDSRQTTLAAPAYWRLDARLSYALPWHKGAEIYVAGQNLAASTHQEFADGLTIPRTYQGGVTVKFGGAR